MQLLTKRVKAIIPSSAWAKQQGQACLVGIIKGGEERRESLMRELQKKGFSCRSIQQRGKFEEPCFVVYEMPAELAETKGPEYRAHVVGYEGGNPVWHIREQGTSKIYRFHNGTYEQYRTSAAGRTFTIPLMTDYYYLSRKRIDAAIAQALKETA